jgi:hypothetical protein
MMEFKRVQDAPYGEAGRSIEVRTQDTATILRCASTRPTGATRRPGNRSADASRHIRELASDKLPHIDALIARAQAVKDGSRSRNAATCASVDVCGLFVDPTLMPPAGDIDLDVRHVRARWRR